MLSASASAIITNDYDDSHTVLLELIASKNNIQLQGDVNNDYSVDYEDLKMVADMYGFDENDASYDNSLDINNDRKVDIYDLAKTAQEYGKSLKSLFIESEAKGGTATSLAVEPAQTRVVPGDTFQLNVTIDTTESVFGISVTISYDPSVLNVTAAAEGSFLGSDGNNTYPIIRINRTEGTVSYDSTRYGTQAGISGSGDVLLIDFEALAEGVSPVDIEHYEIIDDAMYVVTGVSVNNGTVTSDINEPAYISPISDQTVNEGDILNVFVDASDPEGDAYTLSVILGPGSITGGNNYYYSPEWDSDHNNDIYSITIESIEAYEGLTDTESFQLTVIDVNRPPSISSISDKSVDEGQTLSFTVWGSDPDGDTLAYSVVSGPGSISGNTYTYTPGWDSNHDNEVSTVLIEVDDGYGGTYTESFQLTVIDVNRPPAINPVTDKFVDEGVLISFPYTATDPDGDTISYSLVSGPGTVVQNTYGYTPSWDSNHDNEIYTVVLGASDSYGGSDEESFILTVVDVNQDPSIDAVSDKSVDEGQTLNFPIPGSDPEGDALTYSVDSGPGSISGDHYDYTPSWDSNHDNEIYSVTLGVQDSYGGYGTRTFQVTVLDVNRLPTISQISDQSVSEGQTLSFTVWGSDPDGDTLAYSVVSGPGSISGTTYTYTPGWDSNHDNEVYTVTVQASDGHGGTDTTSFQLTVVDVNQAPNIDSYTPADTTPSMDEGTNLAFSVTASDPEGDALTYSWKLDGNEVSAGPSYTYSPGYADSGTHNVVITVLDGHGGNDTQSWSVTVNDVPVTCTQNSDCGTDGYVGAPFCSADDVHQLYRTYTCSNPGTSQSSCSYTDEEQTVETCTYKCSSGACVNNQPPSIDSYSPAYNPTINEGESQPFSITVSDDFGPLQSPQWYLDGVHTVSGNEYTFAANYNSAGAHTVLVNVTDGDLTSEHEWMLTVKNVNRPPSISSIADKSVDEGQTLSFSVSGSDPDGDTLYYDVKSGPGSTSGTTYTFSPNWDINHDNEVYTVEIEVTDGHGGSDTTSFLLTVNDINRPPSMDTIPDKTIEESNTLSFFLSSGSDPDGDTLAYSVVSGPGSISGTTYTYTPGWDSNHDNEVYTVTVQASDGHGGTDTTSFQLTVVDVNQAPNIDSYTPADTTPSMDEGTNLAFSVTASDPEGDALTYSWKLDGNEVSAGPSYTYSPGYADSGVHNVAVSVHDGHGGTAVFAWTVTVNDVKSVDIQLYSGENSGVELPATPQDTAIESVLSSIDGKYCIVQVYDPSIPGDEWDKWIDYVPENLPAACAGYVDPRPAFFNTLHSLDGTLPFYIRMTEDAVLTVSIL